MPQLHEGGACGSRAAVRCPRFPQSHHVCAMLSMRRVLMAIAVGTAAGCGDTTTLATMGADATTTGAPAPKGVTITAAASVPQLIATAAEAPATKAVATAAATTAEREQK